MTPLMAKWINVGSVADRQTVGVSYCSLGCRSTSRLTS